MKNCLHTFRVSSTLSLNQGVLTKDIAYFVDVWPLYPFINRQKFEDAVSSPHFQDAVQHDLALAALYRTVISLGILCTEGGSFAPMEGPAWKVFASVMRSFHKVLLARKTLLLAQVR